MEIFINVFKDWVVIFILTYIMFRIFKIITQGVRKKSYSIKNRIERSIIDLLDIVLALVIVTLVNIGLIEIAKTDNIFLADIYSLMIVLSFFSYVLKKVWIDNSWLKGLKREIKNLYNKVV